MKPLTSTHDTAEFCRWSYSDDPDYAWFAPCGAGWIFNDGGPKENDMNFCPGCGKPLVIDEAESEYED